MEEKHTLLVASKTKLFPLFSNPVFLSVFNISFAESEKEIIQILDDEIFPDAIILDQEIALKNDSSILSEIDDILVMNSALNDSINTRLPVIAITESDDTDLQQKLYDKQIFDIYPKNFPLNQLCIRLHHHIHRYIEEQKRITLINNQQKSAIRHLVQINKKTGVFNKQTFIYKTINLLANNPEKRYSVLICDLDRFKVFNDMFGFSEGDKILEKIGARLRGTISKESTYGHIYADRFVVCAPTSKFHIQEVYDSANAFAKKLFPNFDFVIRYGIYNLEPGELDISKACDHAEMALNSIKQDFTKHFALYDASMIESLKIEQELITDMVNGLKNEEFVIYLQPQYDYTTESLIGAEALVRWQHPTKGLISPSLFIPVFEKNGFITQLDKYIWEKPCKLLRKWIDEGLNPVPVSVNISRQDIYHTDLLKTFDELLKKHNLQAKDLRLEITESAYMDNPSQLIHVAESLRDYGFCLEMDDFGSGYSSLNTLKEVPVDVLKLDMKFISSSINSSSSEENTRGGSILSSVVRMANWLHLPVIAEGIESKEQADYLKSIGCFNMQGFYFAKPMPVKDYEKLMTELPSAHLNYLMPLPQDEKNIYQAAKFLDATTQATLLFNSFVGGAAIIEWTGDNVEVLRMNDQFIEELGTTRENYAKVQKQFINTIAPESRNTFMSTLTQVTKTDKSAFCEINMLPLYQTNSPFWIRLHMRHIGKTVTSNIYYISIENIDFRMQLLQMNTNLSEQLSTIMESVPCGILTLNYGDKITTSYSNETASAMLGYRMNAFNILISKDPFAFISEKDRHKFIASIEQCLILDSKNFSMKVVAITQSGLLKKLQVNGNIMKRTDGSIVINIIYVDIDEAEADTLKAYASQLCSIYQEVFSVDYENDTTQIIKSLFKEGKNWPVISLKRNVTAWIDNFVVPEYREMVSKTLSKENVIEHFSKTADYLSIEYEILLKNGNKSRILTRLIPIPMEQYRFLCCSMYI